MKHRSTKNKNLEDHIGENLHDLWLELFVHITTKAQSSKAKTTNMVDLQKIGFTDDPVAKIKCKL